MQGAPGLQTTPHAHTHLSLALVFLTGCEKKRVSDPGPSQRPWRFLKRALCSFHRPLRGGRGEDLRWETPGQPGVAGRKITHHFFCHSCLPGWRCGSLPRAGELCWYSAGSKEPVGRPWPLLSGPSLGSPSLSPQSSRSRGFPRAQAVADHRRLRQVQAQKRAQGRRWSGGPLADTWEGALHLSPTPPQAFGGSRADMRSSTGKSSDGPPRPQSLGTVKVRPPGVGRPRPH